MKSQVQCCAINSSGVSQFQQCNQLAKNTENPSFCAPHRETLKRGKTITTVDGVMWTQAGWDRHRAKFFLHEKHEEPTELQKRVEELRAQETRKPVEIKKEEPMGSHEYDDTDEAPAPHEAPKTPAQARIREAEAIPAVMAELADLSPEASSRVLAYVMSALGIAPAARVDQMPRQVRQQRTGTGIVKMVTDAGRPMKVEEIVSVLSDRTPGSVHAAIRMACTRGSLKKNNDGTIEAVCAA